MVVEEYLSGVATQAQLARQYNISPHLIIRRRKEYAAGKSARDNDPDLLARDARIRELERMVGKLAMENELLKSERRSWKPDKKKVHRSPPGRAWFHSSGVCDDGASTEHLLLPAS